jgi:hypothetical protein
MGIEQQVIEAGAVVRGIVAAATTAAITPIGVVE